MRTGIQQNPGAAAAPGGAATLSAIQITFTAGVPPQGWRPASRSAQRAPQDGTPRQSCCCAPAAY